MNLNLRVRFELVVQNRISPQRSIAVQNCLILALNTDGSGSILAPVEQGLWHLGSQGLGRAS